MRDDGFLRHFKWCTFINTNFGDTIIGRGQVIRKFIDSDGECRVEIDNWMENIRGFVTNIGPTIVSPPSKVVVLYEKAPEDDFDQAVLNPNPQNLQRGDRLRIKERPGWELPGGYGLAEETGYIYEMCLDVLGYAMIILDNDCTGLDPRVVLGFRLDALEKI